MILRPQPGEKGMTDFFESESFLLPSQVRADVAGRLRETKGIKSIEMRMKGDAIEGGKQFGVLLSTLLKRGVKVSHEFSIKLEFPQGVSREKVLSLVENMPRSKNGSLKVRLELEDTAEAAA